MKHWIHITRPKLKPQTNHLFVSLRGESITVPGVQDIVYACCDGLNIKSVKGKTPSPHIFRHTLATLHTAPYGKFAYARKSLAPRLMQQRLGHMDFETFERIYVHNNPLAEMKEYKALYAEDLKEDFLDRISKEDFYLTLDSLASAKLSSIRDIKEAYENEIKNVADGKSDIKWDEVLTEAQAVSLLANFGIGYRALRLWGLREGICRVDSRRGMRRFIYDRTYIYGLLENYIVHKEALRTYSGSRRQFNRKIKKCRKIMIGRKILILKKDFLECLVEEYPIIVKVGKDSAKDRNLVA